MASFPPQIGPYRVLEELGKGAMGTVYRAEGDDGEVAIKVLHPHLVQDSDEFLARFRREAEVGLQVQHENVVRTYHMGSYGTGDEERHYMVLEYVKGQDLRELLGEIGKVPEELCWHIGREAQKGLRAIHAAGAVHRDIKPENILITPDHVVKVMDLGIAGLMDQAVSNALTTGFIGTALYAAPEQILGEELDPLTDWYSLGLVLFELATGRRVAKSEGIIELMHERLEKSPPRAGEINPQISPFLEEVLAGLLARDRAVRLDHLPTEDSDWWKKRTQAIRAETHQPLRRIIIPREAAFCGREKELDRLRELYQKAAAGEGQVVLLEGEAGIGKSRLVDEFVAGLGEHVHFLFGANTPGGAATVAGAFASAFRDQIGETSSAPYLTDVPALVPAFDALLRGDAAPSGEAPLTKDSLATAFLNAARALADDLPTIILVEDLHFAPEEGLALFAALAHAVSKDRILLIGTAQPTLKAEWTGQLGRLEWTSRMGLERLGAKEVGQLLLATLGSKHLAEELAFQVLVKSDGNPFFLFEILRSLRDERYLTQTDDGHWIKQREIDHIEVPSSVLDLIESRVADLNEDERSLLDMAVCYGFEFDPLVIAEALGLNRTPVLKMLAQLERKHRLVRSAGRRFVFDQHQIQDVLYDRLPELLREDYHAALGEALERGAGKEPDGDTRVLLARHFLEGARGEEALRHLDAALEHLHARYEHAQVAGLARRALEMPGLLEDDARFGVLMRGSEALEHVGRHEDQKALLDEATSIARDLDDPYLLARVGMAHAKRTMAAGKLDKALELARDAERHARRAADGRLIARSLLGVVTVLRLMGKLDEAVQCLETMGDPLADAPDRVLAASIDMELGRLRILTGAGASAQKEVESAIGLFRELGDRPRELVGWSILGNGAWLLGEYEESRRCNEQVIQILETTGHRKSLGDALGNLGLVNMAQGRLGDAKEALERQTEIAREVGNARGEGVGLLNLGSVLALLGDADAARTALTRSTELLRELSGWLPLGSAMRGLAALERQEGRFAEAERWARKSVELRRDQAEHHALAETLLTLGILRADQGDPGGARTHVDEAMKIAEELGSQDLLLQCHIAGARHLARDAGPALALWAEHPVPSEASADVDLRYQLWRLSGDPSHLEAARAGLAVLRENAPPEYRNTMVENVPLHRRVDRGE